VKLIGRIAGFAGLSASAQPMRSARQRVSQVAQKMLNAFYESAEPGGTDAAHWTKAGAFSARQINDQATRETLRNRARYEVANNSMARGIVDTLADDLIGDGPRLQVASDANLSRKDSQAIEQRWNAWADSVGLWQKLRTARKAIAHDGESFLTRINNPKIRNELKLDVVLIEAERVAHPYSMDLDLFEIDGIRFDQANNPISYRVLDHHPDDNHLLQDVDAHEWIDAENIIHYFRRDRAGQARGIPELTPALPQFVSLRGYQSAVLKAARTAASIAMVIQTDSPVDPESAEGGMSATAYDELEIPEGKALALPDGWKLHGMKGDQPTTTFGDFRRQIANDIGRCLSMPVNVVLGDSSQHNFASGKLDHSLYFRKLRVDRSELRTTVLDRIFEWWLAEATLISGYLPQPARRGSPPLRWSWTWPAPQHADPSKEANALKTRLESGVTTLIEECASLGLDWQEVLANQAEVEKLKRELGITPLQAPPTAPARPAMSPAGRDPGNEPDPQGGKAR
jgi:lambda family phage portal protein